MITAKSPVAVQWLSAFIPVFMLSIGSSVSYAQITVTGETIYASQYVWRGYLLADVPVLQPSVDIGFGGSGFSANIWTSFALDDRGSGPKYSDDDEWFLTLTYATSFGNGHGLSFGVAYYTYPNHDNFDVKEHTSPEIFVSVTPSFPHLSPDLTIFYDFNIYDDLYASLFFSEEIPLEKFPLLVKAGIGYNNGQLGVERGFSDITLSLSTRMSRGKVYFEPNFTYVSVLEPTVNPDDENYFSVTIGRSF